MRAYFPARCGRLQRRLSGEMCPCSRAVEVCGSDPKARSGLCSRKDSYQAYIGRQWHIQAAKRQTNEAHHEFGASQRRAPTGQQQN